VKIAALGRGRLPGGLFWLPSAGGSLFGQCHDMLEALHARVLPVVVKILGLDVGTTGSVQAPVLLNLETTPCE